MALPRLPAAPALLATVGARPCLARIRRRLAPPTIARPCLARIRRRTATPTISEATPRSMPSLRAPVVLERTPVRAAHTTRIPSVSESPLAGSACGAPTTPNPYHAEPANARDAMTRGGRGMASPLRPCRCRGQAMPGPRSIMTMPLLCGSIGSCIFRFQLDTALRAGCAGL